MKTKSFVIFFVVVTFSIGTFWTAAADMLNVANLSDCERKGQLAVAMLESRNIGETLEDNLVALQKAYDADKNQGIAIDHHEYVDYQRMLNDIFRKHGEKYVHSDWTPEELFRRERNLCVNVGF